MFGYLYKFIRFAGKQRKHMIAALILGLFQSVFSAFSLFGTAYVLREITEGTADASTVWNAFFIVGGGVLLAAVCSYFSTQFMTYAGYTIAANARIRIADKLKYAPMGYFNEHNLGQIANTATNVAESLQDTLTRCLLLTTKGLFMTLVITAAMFAFDWRIGLVSAAGFVLFLLVNSFLHKAGAKNSDRKIASGDRAVEAVLEYVQGIAVIKSYNLTGTANKKVASAIREERDVNYALEKNYIPFMALQGVVVKLAGVAIIGVSVWLYAVSGMPLYTALTACIASFMVFNDLDTGGNMSALLRIAANSIDKIEAQIRAHIESTLPQDGMITAVGGFGSQHSVARGTLVPVLIDRKNAGKRIPRVYCPVSPPLAETHYTVKELRAAGCPADLVTDAGIPHLMMRENARALYVIGVRICANGDVQVPAGATGPAAIAKHLGIPVYIVAYRHVFDSNFTSAQEAPYEEFAGQDFDIGTVPVSRHPFVDIIPNEWVTSYITPSGIIPAGNPETLKPFMDAGDRAHLEALEAVKLMF